jgi:hypothetical protein
MLLVSNLEEAKLSHVKGRNDEVSMANQSSRLG